MMRTMTMCRIGAFSSACERRGGAFASSSSSVASSSVASSSSSSARDDARDDSKETLGRKRYKARKIVRGMTREALCDVVADVDSYASFVPFCASAAVTPRETWEVARERDATTRGEEYFEADLEIGFKVFSERYTSAVTCARPERVTARSVSSGLFKSMTTTWRFQNLSDAASEEGEGEEDDGLGLPASDGVVVDFEIDFEVNDPVHAAAVSVVFKDVASAQISAFEKRVRSLALAAMR